MKSNFCSPQTGQCRLPTDLRFVAKTLARMNKFFHGRGLAPGAWSKLELAAAEALNNAIEHQCSKHMKAEVVCRWNWTAETIQIEIQDAGNYLPASGEAGLPADPLAERGRGALLIERLVDLVEHTVSAEGHSIRLTKRVGAMQKRPVSVPVPVPVGLAIPMREHISRKSSRSENKRKEF